MKITIVCEVLGAANNGTTIASLNLIKALKDRGHEVKVICPDEDKRGWDGYYILPEADMGPFMNWIIKRNNMTFPRFDEKIFYEACKDADIVHFMIALFISRTASTYVHSLGKPITAGFHAQAQNFSAQFGMLHSKLFNKKVYGWYDKNLFCRATAIHYPTQFIRDVFETTMKRKTNGYVISNGVNKIFKPNPQPKPEQYKDKFCILFTGRFSKEKSHIVLLKAVKLSKHEKDIQLFFAGDGPTLPKVKKYSQKHLTNQPVINFYPREDLVRLINYCDLYCHPAEAEIEAISCLEAIACGLVPVIANSPDCATKNFALDERSLFKVNDSKDLAKKIDYFIENPAELAKMRESYLKESENFEQENCMDMMEKMFLTEIEKLKK